MKEGIKGWLEFKKFLIPTPTYISPFIRRRISNRAMEAAKNLRLDLFVIAFTRGVL